MRLSSVLSAVTALTLTKCWCGAISLMERYLHIGKGKFAFSVGRYIEFSLFPDLISNYVNLSV